MSAKHTYLKTQATIHDTRLSTSSVFWSHILASTGLTKKEIEELRDKPAVKDVCETPTSTDYSWANDGAVVQLREDLQQYIEAVRTLQELNKVRQERKVKVKSFVDDTRYKTTREREVALRLTAKKIAARFTRLNFTKTKIESLTHEIEDFTALEEFIVTNNLIEDVAYLPPNVKIVSLAGNAIHSVRASAIHTAGSMVFLGLPVNYIQNDLEFLRASRSLVIVDLSHNEICDLALVANVLHQHPTIREVDLQGNPIAYMPQYRQVLASHTPLTVIDGVPVTDAERKAITNENQFSAALKEMPAMQIIIDALQGAVSLMPRSSTPEDPAAGKGGKAAAKGAVEKKGGKGKGAEEAHVVGPPAAKKTCIAIKGSWLGQPIAIETDLLQAPTPSVEAENAKTKGAKAKAQEAAPQVSDKLSLKYKSKFDVPIDPDAPLSAILAMPQPLVLYLIDTMQDETVQEFELGKFYLDCQHLTTSTSNLSTAAPLTINKVLIAERKTELGKLKQHIQQLIATDRDLDKQHLESPTPTDNHPAQPGAKKVAAKGAASKAPNDELAQKQAESANRKHEIEEWQAKAQALELNIQRFSGAQVSLEFNVACNPIVPETPPTTARTDAEDPKGAKGKPKKR